jgi:hypothetical protein
MTVIGLRKYTFTRVRRQGLLQQRQTAPWGVCASGAPFDPDYSTEAATPLGTAHRYQNKIIHEQSPARVLTSPRIRRLPTTRTQSFAPIDTMEMWSPVGHGHLVVLHVEHRYHSNPTGSVAFQEGSLAAPSNRGLRKCELEIAAGWIV